MARTSRARQAPHRPPCRPCESHRSPRSAKRPPRDRWQALHVVEHGLVRGTDASRHPLRLWQRLRAGRLSPRRHEHRTSSGKCDGVTVASHGRTTKSMPAPCPDSSPFCELRPFIREVFGRRGGCVCLQSRQGDDDQTNRRAAVGAECKATRRRLKPPARGCLCRCSHPYPMPALAQRHARGDGEASTTHCAR